MSEVQAYLDAHYENILAELTAFVRIPSVSTDPAYREQIEAAARWVAGQLEMADLSDVRIMRTNGHPVVYGEWMNAPGAPTILGYGHYDVQPPDPLDKWTSKPFEPEVRDGRLYGRGVSDDKGPVFIPIKVAQAYLAMAGKLPINVKFLIEGEEEIGSPSLEPFIHDNADLLKADFVLSADGAMWRIDVPSVTIASRGLVGLEFTLTGAKKDLHSGRYGGAVANPLHAMAALVGSLHTPDGRVAVEGYYDEVKELSAVERAALAGLPFDDAGFQEQVGARGLFGEAGYTTLERLWARPTLEVNGMWGGYEGVGSKTVIPSQAHAKLTCRLVADQRPQDIQDKVASHLEKYLPRGVRLTIKRDRHGALPYQMPGDHVGLKVAVDVLKAVYQQQPVYVRMGGTIPVSEVFKRVLGIDTVFFSFSTADEDYHAPNEFFRLDSLRNGLKAWALYWQLLAETMS
jgi:acetylornithine deacetylase/succinyl-diaminopimelate desuccinylase-like protein